MCFKSAMICDGIFTHKERIMSEIHHPQITPQDHIHTESRNLRLPKLHIGMRNIKTAFAATLCALIYFLIDRNPTFACIGAVFGMGGDLGQSKLSGGNRLFGTIIGGLIGMGLFRIYIMFHPEGGFRPLMLLLLFIGVVIMILISTMVKWPGAIQPGGVMLCIILFNTPVDTYVAYSLNRILDTAIGVIIALIINALLPQERWLKIKHYFLKKNKGSSQDVLEA
jgi:uncharacterized membrane protein YgaE (UPF0421/DUF939 family)